MSENKEDVIISDIEIIDQYKNVDVITDIVFEGKTDVNIKDIQYMCDYISKNEGCEFCPFNSGKICGYAVLLKKFNTGREINNTVLNWLKDNPPTSYLMDIKVKMPTVDISNTNIPNFCVQSIYGKNCCDCLIKDTSKFDNSDMYCRKCWRTPMDENIKKYYH